MNKKYWLPKLLIIFKKHLLLLCFLILCFFGNGCFTTLQTAKVKKGFQVSINTGILSDQKRNGKFQGNDFVGFVTPSYGACESVGVEFGLPMGLYLEEGLNSLKANTIDEYGYDASLFLILPYLKLGFNQLNKDKFAIICQSILIEPISLTILFSHDFRCFTPYMSLKTIFGGGAPLDKIFLGRYQQNNQSVLVFTIGVEFNVKSFPALEVGVMRNSFQEDTDKDNIILYDLLIGMKITL